MLVGSLCLGFAKFPFLYTLGVYFSAKIHSFLYEQFYNNTSLDFKPENSRLLFKTIKK